MNGMWKAENYNYFSKMTVRELNNFAGRKRDKSPKISLLSGRDIYFNDSSSNNYYEDNMKDVESMYRNRFMESSIRKIKENNKLKSNINSESEKDEILFPEEFLEYKKYMSNPRSQVHIFISFKFFFSY
jgi:hypothetical protein